MTGRVAGGHADRGVLLCGSGVGVSVATNKVAAIRHDTFSARQGVEDDAMNVPCLGARVIGPELAVEVVGAFASAEFLAAERNAWRPAKVIALESAGAPQITGGTE